LNAYVRVHTGFTPIDCDDALLAVEPEVPSPKLQGFPWEKLKQGTAFLHLTCVTASYAVDHCQDVRLVQELSTSLYTFITRGKYPMWYKDRQDLVEYGIARFMGEGQEVIVEELMALVGILRYFEAEGFTIDRDIRARMQSAKGSAFKEAVLLSCTRLFRVGPRLSDIFSFEGDVPDWAHQRAHIVSQKGQELEVSDIVNENLILPSPGVAYYAKNPNDVKDWIISKRSMWCIPGRYMGPDLLAWLRLDDGKLLLLIQAKCYLEGNIDTLVPKVTSKAIQSLNTDNFYSVCYSSSFLSGLADLLPEGQICEG
jgi:hypothetical protein